MTTNMPDIELNPWHKRQAALIHHFASLDYLKGLKSRVDELIAWTDAVLGQRAPLDAIGLADLRWKATDTSAHFSTYAFPALLDFQQSVVSDIASRTFEDYGLTGAYQCSRMLDEYGHSMLWATREQEDAFKDKFEQASNYAGYIDGVTRRPPPMSDFSHWIVWNEHKHLFPKLPKFRVRTDIEGESGSVPPRTGIYVPQNDPYGTLQFAWTGGGYGRLGPVVTLSNMGKKALQAVGRNGLWDDGEGLLAFALQHLDQGIQKNNLVSAKSDIPDPSRARSEVRRHSFGEHRCKWYFVELIEGEFEEHDGTYTGATTGSSTDFQSASVPGGQPCPRAGWWSTPAKAASRTWFKEGDIMPAIADSNYGLTFWQWDTNQSNPAL